MVKVTFQNSTVYADKFLVIYSRRDNTKHKYVEFDGNVVMEHRGTGNFRIKSQKAYSYDFKRYLEFAGNVVAKENDSEIKADKYIFNFSEENN